MKVNDTRNAGQANTESCVLCQGLEVRPRVTFGGGHHCRQLLVCQVVVILAPAPSAPKTHAHTTTPHTDDKSNRVNYRMELSLPIRVVQKIAQDGEASRGIWQRNIETLDKTSPSGLVNVLRPIGSSWVNARETRTIKKIKEKKEKKGRTSLERCTERKEQSNNQRKKKKERRNHP